MSQEDYEAGRRNPTAAPNVGEPGWLDFRQGQLDEEKSIQESYARMSGVPGRQVTRSSGPRRKSVIFAVFLAFVAGPFGLLYATWKGALALIAAWIGLPMFLIWMDVHTAAEANAVAAEELPDLLARLWPVVWVASLALAALATSRYNRRILAGLQP